MDLLDSAQRAAKLAAAYLRTAVPPAPDRWTAKGQNDFVTEVDRHAEEIIRSSLLIDTPNARVIGEELGPEIVADGLVWVVDPLDGTTNFLHGFPQYAVSIALMHREVVTQAVIYDPGRNDLFTASRGRGAFVNDQRMRVGKRPLKGGLIGTGLPFKEQPAHLEAYLAMLRDVMKGSAGVRRAGSATLDLAYVAAGRLDGFWEIGLSPWDIAAGSLMIIEAGGLVGDLEGESHYLTSGNIVAGNPRAFADLLRTIAPHLIPSLKRG
jgi:myo-inositol-1(or 4)-monophosphatase